MNHDEGQSEILSEWRREVSSGPDVRAKERARHAMLATLNDRRATGSQPIGSWRLRARWAAAPALMSAVLIVIGLGWNAPTGSALHAIRSAREGLALSLPGADDFTLHMRYAEEHLSDAEAGIDRAANLADARNELTQAHALLPASLTSPQWSHWNQDEQRLERDEATPPPTVPATPKATATPPAQTSGHPDNAERETSYPSASARPSEHETSTESTAGDG